MTPIAILIGKAESADLISDESDLTVGTEASCFAVVCAPRRLSIVIPPRASFCSLLLTDSKFAVSSGTNTSNSQISCPNPSGTGVKWVEQTSHKRALVATLDHSLNL